MSWPKNIPFDLCRKIDPVLSMRNSDANQIWMELLDWRIEYGVDAPGLPVETSRETDLETMHNDGG